MPAEPRIVCAPNAFKGALTATAAAEAIAAGVRDVTGPRATVLIVPIADGGDGTLPILLAAHGGTTDVMAVTGPTGKRAQARLGWLDRTSAVVELAEASGLRLLDEPAPLTATSRGTGELIAAALDRGATRIILGAGGSASSDGGAGILAALGVRPMDAAGLPLGGGGGSLARIHRLDTTGRHPRLEYCRVEVACDVRNPLLGPRGAAFAFAPQKGADPAQVLELERGLTRWAGVVERDLATPPDLARRPRTGAAGGAGFGLAALGAMLLDGAAVVADATGLDEALVGAALCITGEGRLDRSTNDGKGPAEVALRCATAGVPCVVLAGVVEAGVHPLFAETVAVSGDGDLHAAIAHTAEALRRAAAGVVRRRLLTAQ